MLIIKNIDFNLFPDAESLWVDESEPINNGDVVVIKKDNKYELRFAWREGNGYSLEYPNCPPEYNEQVLGKVVRYSVNMEIHRD